MNSVSNILMSNLTKQAFPGSDIVRRGQSMFRQTPFRAGKTVGNGFTWAKNNPGKTTAIGAASVGIPYALGRHSYNKAYDGAQAGVNSTPAGMMANQTNKLYNRLGNFGSAARNWAGAHPAAAGALGLGVPAALLAALMSEEHPYRNAILSGLLMGGVGAIGNSYLHSRGNV